MKFIPEDSQVVLREIPDEISLSVNISDCPHRCKGCHSAYLQENKGDELTVDAVDKLITRNTGISCVCFFGGDRTHSDLRNLISKLRKKHSLKFAVYSGDDEPDDSLASVLDYYKIGHYDSEYGPLDSPSTNQRLYAVSVQDDGSVEYKDITFKFWSKIL